MRWLRAASDDSDGIVATVVPATEVPALPAGHGEPNMRTDIDHIDALVKRTDPVNPLSLAGPDSPEAEGIWERLQAAVSLGTDPSLVPRPGPMRARRLVLPVMGVGAFAAVVILVLQLLPAPVLQPPSAAAAVLRHLARQAAAAEPPPILKDDQWLQSEFHVSYLAAPPHGGPESAALQSARAVVTVNAESWANDLSQYCSQQVVTSVAYNSPASQQAWSSSSSGLPTSTPQPQCGSGPLGTGGEGRGPLDVAQLPTDPAALTQAIETGTTGISALDKPHHYLTPFGRAVALLVGPDLWVHSGTVVGTAPSDGNHARRGTPRHRDHTQRRHRGGSGWRHCRGIPNHDPPFAIDRNAFGGEEPLGRSAHRRSAFGVVTIQSIDPTGTPQVVDASLLPSSLAGQVPTGIVSAITNPGVSLDRWNAWLHSVLPTLSAGAALTSTPGVYAVSVVTHTPDPDIAGIKRLFQGSGLVHGIRSARG